MYSDTLAIATHKIAYLCMKTIETWPACGSHTSSHGSISCAIRRTIDAKLYICTEMLFCDKVIF